MIQKLYSVQESSRTTFLEPHRYVTFKYSQITALTVASGAASAQVYNLNSLFDPDRTGTGTQPYGFNQLSDLYNRYRVLKASYKVVFFPTTGTFISYVLPSNGLVSVAPTTQQTFTDNTMNPRARTYTQGLNAEAAICKGTIVLNDLNGCTPNEYLSDDRFEAQVSTSPTEVMVLNIGVYNPTAGSLGINFSTEIYFHTDLHDPILLGPS